MAQRIFLQVKHHCRMGDWQVELVADDNPLAQDGMPSVDMIAPRKHALGTFGVAGNRIEISYVPTLLRRPEQLIYCGASNPRPGQTSNESTPEVVKTLHNA